MIIPDYFEPLVGWRCWAAVDTETGGLKALAHSYYWMPGKAVQARCKSCGGPAKPFFEKGDYTFNQVGMYAFKTVQQLVEDKAFGPVIGQVYLWGQVVEATRGWRAEFAYPKELVTSRQDYKTLLEAKWRVPVYVGDVNRIFQEAKEKLRRKVELAWEKEHNKWPLS